MKNVGFEKGWEVLTIYPAALDKMRWSNAARMIIIKN